MTDLLGAANGKDIAARNDVLAKKSTNMEAECQEFQRTLELCVRGSHHLQKLTDQTDEKCRALREESISKNDKIKKEFDSVNSEISISFQSLLQLKQRVHKPNDIQGAERLEKLNLKDIVTACNSALENCRIEKETCGQNIDELRETARLSKKKCETLRKEKSKCEADIADLEEEIRKKNGEIEMIKDRRQCEEKGELEKLQMEKAESDEKYQTLLNTMTTIDEQLKTISVDVDTKKADLDLRSRDFEQHFAAKTKNLETSNYSSNLQEFVCDDEEINSLIKGIEVSCNELSTLEKEVGTDVSTFQYSQSDSLESLSAELCAIEDICKELELENEKMAILHQRYLMNKEMIEAKILEESRLKQQLNEETLKLESLKRIQHQTNTSLKTPEKVVRKKNQQVSAIPRISSTINQSLSDFFPGIIPIKRKKTEEVKSTFDDGSLEESSMSSFDSCGGTTNDGSLMGGMFSPLREPVEDNNEEVEEFSMMDHFRQFSQRATNKSKHTNTFDNTFTNETISRRISGNDFLDSKDNSLDKKSSNVSAQVSTISGDEDEDGWIANSSAIDMDQSVWGSD